MMKLLPDSEYHTAYLASPALLDAAQRIFGKDMVTKAFFASPSHPTPPSEKSIGLLRSEAALFEKRYNGTEDIQLPTGGEVVLEFHNGQQVSVSTSEWGSINSTPVGESVTYLDHG